MSSYLSLPGAVASGNIATSQHRAVKLSGSNPFEVSAITNANAPELPVGILQDAPNVAGKGADVAIAGVCKAEFGDTVTIGQTLGMDNSGRLISAPFETSPATADLYVFAVALEAGAVGTKGMVRLIGPVLASTE